MKYGPLALGVLLCAAAMSSSAAAQQAASTGVTATGMIQGRQQRQIKFDALADVEHDTNLARTNAILAAQRNITPEDTIGTPTLSVDVVEPIGRQAVFVNGSVGYRFHKNNPRLDREHIDLLAGAGGSLGPCGAVADGGYLRGLSEVTDQTSLTQVDSLRVTRRADLNLACTRPTGLGVVLGGGREWVKNSLAQVALTDHNTTTAMAGVSYQRPSSGSLTLFGQFNRTRYPHRATSGPKQSGIETRAIGLTATRQLGGRIQATATAGYTKLRRIGDPLVGAPVGGATSFSGATYSGDVTYRATSRLSAEVSAARQVSPSLVTAGSYQVRTNYDGHVDYKIGSRITFTLGADRSRINIGGQGVVVAGAPTLTNSRTTKVFTSLAYKLNQRLSFTLNGENEKRTSDNAQLNYVNNRVTLSADASF